jgi:hypothetical protein
MNFSIRKHLSLSVSCACLLAAVIWGGTQAKADTYTWTTWNSATSSNDNTSTAGSATGTAGAVTVTYTGQTDSLGGPSWGPSTSYVGGIVGNAPPSGSGIVNEGGQAYTETITFSSAVVDPAIAIWSLGGQNGITASFDFTNEPFTIVACGPSSELGGDCITSSGTDVYGDEGNGTILFNGTFSSITFTQPIYEHYDEFTVGYDTVALVNPPPPSATPEPSSLALLGTSILGAAGVLRRRLINR